VYQEGNQSVVKSKAMKTSISVSALVATVCCCILSPAFAAEAPNSHTVPVRVWLSDLPEQNVKVGYGNFGKNGWAGFDARPIQLKGLGSQHGLGTHPDCHVEYVLRKRFRTFRGTAFLDSSARHSDWPIEFRVLGDGKLLWKSFGMHDRHDVQPCLLDITGVDRLRLEVVFRPDGSGDRGHAHAVWIEPYVETEPPRPEVLSLFDPKPFTRLEADDLFRARVRDLFNKEKFSDLESLVNPLRKKDEYWAGLSALNAFYLVVDRPEKPDDAAEKEHFERLERWQKAMPDSLTPRIALGDAYLHYAWVARGTGYADTITEQGAKLMKTRAAKASDYFEEALKLKPADPDPYVGMMEVLQLQGASLEEQYDYFNAGRKIAPRHFPLYTELAKILLPKWYGAPGDVAKYAAKLRKEIGGELGDEIYFRMAAYYLQEYGGDRQFFARTGFDYEALRPGILIALRDYPENARLYNSCCYLACKGDDKELARRLLPRLDAATFEPTCWHGLAPLEYFRERFYPQCHADELARTVAPHVGVVTSVTCLHDGSFLVGGEWPLLERFNIVSGDWLTQRLLRNQVGRLAVDDYDRNMVISHGQMQYAEPVAFLHDLRDEKEPPKPLEGHSAGVTGVAISRDGNRCVTASSDKTARLWNLSDLSEPLVLKHPEPLFDAAFAYDGQTLFTTSEKGGLWQWDAASGKLRGGPLVDVNKGPWYCRVCCFPKSNRLVTASIDGTIRRWDIGTRKFAETKPGGYQIISVAVSPDEKWIAVGREYGEVDVFCADTLHLMRRYKEHCGAVHGLSFSSDSQTLASGAFDSAVKLWPVGRLQDSTVKQATDGSIHLAAGDAQIIDSHLVVEGGRLENLGHWDNAHDRPAWTVEVAKAGAYIPELIYSASPGNGGSQIELACGDAKSRGTIVQTEGWYDYQSLTLPPLKLKAGTVKVTLVAAKKAGSFVMNLRGINLTPVQPVSK